MHLLINEKQGEFSDRSKDTKIRNSVTAIQHIEQQLVNTPTHEELQVVVPQSPTSQQFSDTSGDHVALNQKYSNLMSPETTHLYNYPDLSHPNSRCAGTEAMVSRRTARSKRTNFYDKCPYLAANPDKPPQLILNTKFKYSSNQPQHRQSIQLSKQKQNAQ